MTGRDQQQPQDRLLRVSQIAEALGLSADTIDTWAIRHGLPFVRLPSGQRRYLISEVRAWLREQQRTSR